MWQARRLATSTCVWRGGRGTCGCGLALVARFIAVSRPGRRGALRGRRGTCSHPPSFCVAGVAPGDIYLRLAWQPCTCGRLVAVSGPGHRSTLRGRRGTCSHPPSFCAAGLALGDIYLRLAWHAWPLWHWAGSGGAWSPLVAVSRPGRRGTLRAGVALGDIYLRFAWQAWHLWHLATSTFVWRGMRGTCGTGLGLAARSVTS